VEVVWRPFEIHPEVPAEGAAPRPGMERLGEGLERMAQDEGLDMSRPPLRANSHLAMVGDLFARDQGQPEPYHSNMFKAYWQDHRNIGLREVVLDVARESGLDAAELEQALNDGRYEPEMASVYDECGQYGINGVPTFIIGRYMVVGAQPYEMLERALTLAEQEEAAEA
jgi:predicted DsbA family dithiol-disulfide isomerase